MDDAPAEADPLSERGSSNCSRAAGCFVLGVLLLIAAAFGARQVLAKSVPVLVHEKGRTRLLFDEAGSVGVILGPGCSAPAVEPAWEDLRQTNLTWLGDDHPRRVRVRLMKRFVGGQPSGWRVRVGDEQFELGQSALLLPSGEVIPFDEKGAGPLLEIQRWEGALATGKVCVVTIYRPLRGPFAGISFSHVVDGHELGRSLEGTRSSGPTLELAEVREGGRRTIQIAGKAGTYLLEVNGQAPEKVDLQLTSQTQWPE